jgi:hypothetical protein
MLEIGTYRDSEQLMNIQTRIRRKLSNVLLHRGYKLERINVLMQLADCYGSDKGTLRTAHRYTRVYEHFFRPIRNDALVIAEMGLLRSDVDGRKPSCAAEGETTAVAYSAPSLQMWRAYFPNADIFGFDIDDFSAVKIDNCNILRGDMSSKADLLRLAHAIGRPIDIIIDDASHASHHQQIALGTLFPFVRDGGFYIIEDLHWQNDLLEVHNAPKTRDLLRRLQIDNSFKSPFLSKDEQTYIESCTSGIWLFDSLSPEGEDTSDAIAFLKKRSAW